MEERRGWAGDWERRYSHSPFLTPRVGGAVEGGGQTELGAPAPLLPYEWASPAGGSPGPWTAVLVPSSSLVP